MEDLYQFLDEIGTDKIFDIIQDLGFNEFTSRLVNSLEEDSTDDQILTGLGFNELYQAVLIELISAQINIAQLGIATDNLLRWYLKSHVVGYIQIVTGELDQMVKNPEPNVLYIQRDSGLFDFYTLWVWDGHWMSVCNMKEILKEYLQYGEIAEFAEWFQHNVIRPFTKEELEQIVLEVYHGLFDEAG